MQNQENNLVVDSLTPVGFRVLLNIYKKPLETSSGFILPESENTGMPVVGQIVELGKKTWLQHLVILFGLKAKYKVGQWVYFRKYSVDEFIVETPSGKVTVYMLEENEINGLINKDENI